MKNIKHPIFKPVELWHKKLINRTVVAPMSRVSASANGSATEDMNNYYTAFTEICFGRKRPYSTAGI